MILLKRALHGVFKEYALYRVCTIDTRDGVEPRPGDFTFGLVRDSTELQNSPYPEIKRYANAVVANNHLLGAWRTGQLVGLCCCSARTKQGDPWTLRPGEAALSHIVTAMPYRSLGIATKLITFAVRHMGEAGYVRLYAWIWHSNIPSVRAFQKAGWKDVTLSVALQVPGLDRQLRFSLPGFWLLRFRLSTPQNEDDEASREASDAPRMFSGTPRPLRSLARKIVRALRREGISGVVKLSIMNLRRSLTHARSRPAWSLFDAEHRVDTGGIIELSDLDVRSPNYAHGVRYQATPVALFSEMLDSIDFNPEEYVFIDFGSGKGRALLLASERPFKRIIGVEFAPELHRVAQQNIQHYRSESGKCKDLYSVCMDATEFVMPEEPAIFYFYHPFDAGVMSKVLSNIQESLKRRPRPTYIIYYNPQAAGIVEQAGVFSVLKSTSEYSIYANSLARVEQEGRSRILRSSLEVLPSQSSELFQSGGQPNFLADTHRASGLR
jgi:ribosomal protein S18 acetylase RimI-like enzyme